jgi:hypothetical protein
MTSSKRPDDGITNVLGIITYVLLGHVSEGVDSQLEGLATSLVVGGNLLQVGLEVLVASLELVNVVLLWK